MYPCEATILKLFLDLKKTFDLTYIFISHDLSVVRMMCDRLAVMYLGKVVELSPTDEVFDTPRHPYTQSLLSACLKLEKQGSRRIFGWRVNHLIPLDCHRAAALEQGARFKTQMLVGNTRSG